MNVASWRTRLSQQSLALRIAVSVTLFGLIVAGAAGAFGYWALSRQLDARLDAEVRGKRGLLLHVLSEIATVEAVPANGHRFGDLLIGHPDLHLAVLDASTGRLLASFSRTGAESVARVKRDATASVAGWLSSDGKRYASLAGTGPVRDGQTVWFVLTIDPEDDQALLRGFVGATLLGLPILLAFVALGAWVVARTGLAPLNRLTSIASRVTPRNLGHRIVARGLPRELMLLAEGFNAMLQRIDEGVSRLSEFSGNLAHEMRTPVATLLGRTQVALSRQRSVAELHEVLAGNVEELDRLTRLIADMLFLAQADQGSAPLRRSTVDLAQEARKVTEFLSAVAEERAIKVEITGSATVQADRTLVQRAITNLLTNAIRHSDAAGVVSLALRQTGTTAYVEVSNRGNSIPPSQLHRIFERFVRLDAARTRSDGGTGLGLPIIKSVMHAHGGSVDVTSEAGGLTTFTLEFPRELSAAS